MKTKISLYLVAFLTFLVVGCSKSDDAKPTDPPVSDSDKISIPVGTSYQGEITVLNNTLALSVAGQPDLTFFLHPGQDTVITLTGAEATSRKGKAATLTMTCTAVNNEGAPITVCYNHENGYTINSLQSSNQKVEWIGQTCSAGGDNIILRVKITFQYGNNPYTVQTCGFRLEVDGFEDLGWQVSPTADTTVVISGQAAIDRIGKPYAIVFTDFSLDPYGVRVPLAYNYPNGRYIGTQLLADNSKVEFIAHN